MIGRAARLSAALASLFVFLSFAPAAQADPAPDWVNESPASAPQAREGAAMAYDATSQEMVLFGGETLAGVRLNDTWTWDGEDWTRKSPAVSPSPRNAASMAFDKASGQMLLIGGQSHEGILDETWTWDGSNWTELSPATPAPTVANPSIAYDAGTEAVLLFGGMGTDAVNRDSTWSWDGSTWTRLSPQSSPSPRWGASMTYDPENAEMVLFGGFGENAGTDTWTWNGTDWTRESPAVTPPLSYGNPMAFSTATGSVIKMSAQNASTSEAETWSWDGSDWSQVGTVTNPIARFSYPMALDEARNELVVFGGLTMEGILGDTMTFGLQDDQTPTDPDPGTDPDPEENVTPECQEVRGGLAIDASRRGTGLRIRIGVRGDVDAKISPKVLFATRTGRRKVALGTRTARIARAGKLRFRLPDRATRQLRRATKSGVRTRVRIRLGAELKSHGDQAECFRKVDAVATRLPAARERSPRGRKA